MEFRVRIFSPYFSVEKANFLLGQKRPFFLRFEHLRKSKQTLYIYLVEKIHRFVFEKFVKTCRELDLFWEPDATEGGVTVTAGEPRVLPACRKKKKY